MKSLFFLIFTFVASNAVAAIAIKDFKASAIDAIRIHTSAVQADFKNVVTIKTSAMAHEGWCTKGGYIRLEGNEATYSAILASYMVGKDVSVQIDTSMGLTGGGYCGILYFDIKK